MAAQAQLQLVRTLNATIGSLCAANVGLHTSMQTQLDTEQEATAALQEQAHAHANMQTSLDDLQETNEALQAQIRALQDNDVPEQVRTRDATIRAQCAHIDGLDEANAALQEQVKERDATIRAQQTQINAQQIKIDAQQTKIDELKALYDERGKMLDSVIESTKRIIKLADERFTQLAEQINAQRVEIAGLKSAQGQQLERRGANSVASCDGAPAQRHSPERATASTHQDGPVASRVSVDNEQINSAGGSSSARDIAAADTTRQQTTTATGERSVPPAQKRKYDAVVAATDETSEVADSSSAEEAARNRRVRSATEAARSRRAPLSRRTTAMNGDLLPSSPVRVAWNLAPTASASSGSASGESDADDPTSHFATFDTIMSSAEEDLFEASSVADDEQPARSQAWIAETRDRFTQALAHPRSKDLSDHQRNVMRTFIDKHAPA